MAINRFVKVGGNSQRRRSPITCMKLFIAIAVKQILIWPYRHGWCATDQGLARPGAGEGLQVCGIANGVSLTG